MNQRASTYSSLFESNHWFIKTFGDIVLEHALSIKTFLFRHNVAVEEGGKVAHETNPIEARGAHTFESTTICMKMKILQEMSKHETRQYHIGKHVDRSTELLVNILAALRGTSSKATCYVGVIR